MINAPGPGLNVDNSVQPALTSGGIDVDNSFFDANFGKWEDDTNTLATVKKLSVSPEDAPASRKTASRGSRRSNASRGSSRRSRAGSATTKNRYYLHDQAYKDGVLKYKKTAAASSTTDETKYYSGQQLNKKWKKATSPRIIVNGNTQTLKIGFFSEKSDNKTVAKFHSPTNRESSNEGGTIPLRPFSRMRGRDLQAQLAKKDTLKNSYTIDNNIGVLDPIKYRTTAKQAVLTVKFSEFRNDRNEKYSHRKVPPGPLWGRDAYYKPKITPKNRIDRNNLQHQNYKRHGSTSTINITSEAGEYKARFLSSTKSHTDIYTSGNVAKHVVYPILGAGDAVKRVRRIIGASK